MPTLRTFAVLALAGLACLLSARPSVAETASCTIAPYEPAHLMSLDGVADYRSVLRACRNGAEESVAIREMSLAGEPALLLADPQNLSTRLARAACWSCKAVDEADLADTRLMRAVEASAEAPGLTRRGFLQNAGLTHGASSGAYFTGDLCPSTKPLDRAFLRTLAEPGSHTPVALSISGLWLTHHFADFRWLLDLQAEGDLDITWTNHSYHHAFRRGVPNERNFMLSEGVDPDAEILDTERLLIANGQTPSLFFRFPGLISSAPLMQATRRHHLIALGADAWLAIRQKPKPGSIILVHPNGNEENGLAMFDRDMAQGLIARPFAPLATAPN
jgi:hypothetical protein